MITLDVGDSDDIHPRDKKTVGERLAAIALTQDYSKPTHYRGPVLQSAHRKGQNIIVQFKAPEGLQLRDGKQQVHGFEVTDGEGQLVTLAGRIKGDTVILDGAALTINPVMLHYAWRDDPKSANLQDSKGLPAEPARVQLK